MSKFIDLTGQKFGRLTILKEAGRRRKTNQSIEALWFCRCSCGTEKTIRSSLLRSGDTQSCGCLQKERTSEASKHPMNSETKEKISKARKGIFIGDKNGTWKGGRSKTKVGYINLWNPNHPNANTIGYVKEHVFVMSSILNRPLLPGETIHHKNGIKDDNRPKNLELRLSNHGKGQRIDDLISCWREMLKLYAPNLLKEEI